MEAVYIMNAEKNCNLMANIRKKYIWDNTNLRNVTFSPALSSFFYDHPNNTRVFIENNDSVYQFRFNGEELNILKAKLELENAAGIKIKLQAD